MKYNIFFEIADCEIAELKLQISDCKFQIDVVGTGYEFNLKMRSKSFIPFLFL